MKTIIVVGLAVLLVAVFAAHSFRSHFSGGAYVLPAADTPAPPGAGGGSPRRTPVASSSPAAASSTAPSGFHGPSGPPHVVGPSAPPPG